MTTMTRPRPKASRSAIRRATGIAARLLEGCRLPPEVTAEQLAAAFGRAIAITSPRSPHGQILAAALQDRTPAQRTPAERVTWWLAARGQTPTEDAVTRKLAEVQAQRAREEERKHTADLLARRDGPKAAQYVAGVIARTGAGPTWRELAAAMGWPDGSSAAVIHRMTRAGWLEPGDEPRSLRPGRSAR